MKEAPIRGNAVIAWNQAALEAVRRTRLGPPMVARAIHILHTAMYDTWAAYDHRAVGTRLGDLLRRPPAERSEDAKRECIRYQKQIGRIIKLLTVQEIPGEEHVQKM